MSYPNPSDVIDHACGKVRVLSRRCSTCIFWPDDRMHLGAERTREVVAANLAANALLTCHATLPYGRHPEFGPAVCAGFWARHGLDVAAGRIAEQMIGLVRVDPPDEAED